MSTVIDQHGYWTVIYDYVCYLGALLPGLEAAGQGAVHEQLGNTQQLVPHVPLVHCPVSPRLEGSEQHRTLNGSVSCGVPCKLYVYVSYTLEQLPWKSPAKPWGPQGYSADDH